MKYTPVIGLEVHVELKTQSKMFCSCSADYFGKEPNSHTCPVCLGLPGALPVPNQTAIEWCVKIGLALNCNIPLFAKFDRKNYFYPDLAKGYQISQYDDPFAVNGYIELASGKRIGIRRVHMEEDTGKLTHQDNASLVDFNRSGVPLVEIVTEPDFDNAKDVKEYLQKLQQIVRYLDVSNADMEKGDMRLEPNISLKVCHPERSEGSSHGSERDSSATPQNDTLPPYKVEVKNINSFRFVEKAIAYEVKRQAEILDEGKTPAQETRGWNETKQATFSQRAKEEANDYRYFPEPDIPPIRWDKKQIETFRSQMPEMPAAKLKRFMDEYSLSAYDAEILTREVTTAGYFEEAVKTGSVILVSEAHPESPKKKTYLPAGRDAGQASMTKKKVAKQLANWIINKKTDITSVSPEALVKQIAAATQTVAIDEDKLQAIIDDVLANNQKAVEDYKSGKETVIMYLVGQVIRQAKAKIDAQMVKEKIIDTVQQ